MKFLSAFIREIRGQKILGCCAAFAGRMPALHSEELYALSKLRTENFT